MISNGAAGKKKQKKQLCLKVIIKIRSSFSLRLKLEHSRNTLFHK